MKKTPEERYQSWSRFTGFAATVYGYGIIPFAIAFFYSIKYFNRKPLAFWLCFAALLIWCAAGFFVVKALVKKEKHLKHAAGIGVPAKITNPLFRELLDEYEKNRLERLTKNEFFRSWKLMSDELSVNDCGVSFLTLWFMKKEREVLLEFSEKEVSVTVDEESNSGNESPALPMDGFQNLDELYRAVTGMCQTELEKE